MDLRWIEADFTNILDYKDARLGAERPRCRGERVAVDVNDAEQRSAVYAAVGAEPALRITAVRAHTSRPVRRPA